MVYVYPEVVGAKVLSHMAPAIPYGTQGKDPHDPAKPIPPGHLKAGGKQVPPGERPETSTLFTVHVIKSLHGKCKPGDQSPIAQNGSYFGGRACEVEGDRLMKNGETYLLFLKELPGRDMYYGTAFGRFTVGPAQKLSPWDEEFTQIPAVQMFSGQTLAEAQKLIAGE